MASLIGKDLDEKCKVIDLYNPNRSFGEPGHRFLEWCLEENLIDIKVFRVKQARNWLDFSDRAEWMSEEVARSIALSKAVGEVRAYSQEKDEYLETLANLLYQFKRMGQKIKCYESVRINRSYCFARIHVPEWNLFISPTTQTLRDLLTSLIQIESTVWVTSKFKDFQTFQELPVIFVIEKNEGFYEAYERYNKLLENCITEGNAIYKLREMVKDNQLLDTSK